MKAKDALFKELNVGKVTLANELKDAQEKLHGNNGGGASVEFFLKLTTELKNKLLL